MKKLKMKGEMQKLYNYEIKILERKEKMKNKINLQKHQNGITLIALVVTIIVLLILARC